MEMNESPNTPHMAKGGHHMAARHEHHKRAKGGKAPVQEYNAQGSKEVKDADDEDPEFKKGGKATRKAGGKAEGEHTRRRGDRMPRGKAEPKREERKAGGRTHEGHGHHEEHEHEVEHKGEHGVHHHGAHGHAVHSHGSGDIHVHRRKGGEAGEHEHERRARGGRMSGGHSPYSAGKMLRDEESSSGAAAGHEGQKVATEPD